MRRREGSPAVRRREILVGCAGIAGIAGTAPVSAGRPASDAGTVSPAAASVGAAAEPFEPLGFVDVEGAKDAAVAEDGTTVYLATTDGFATIDISDPEAPTVLAERRDLLAEEEDGPLDLIWDVWPDGDRLAVVGPATSSSPTEINAALLFDVNDPADPELLSVHRTEHPIHNCFFDDGIVYLTLNRARGNPVVLLDADDDELVEVGRWSLLDYDEAWEDVFRWLRQLHDLYVQDGLAYLAYWDAGTWILDVSDPSTPEYVGHVADGDPEELAALDDAEINRALQTLPGNAHYVQVDEAGELLGVGREAWAVETDGERVGGPGGIDLYDVSDPTTPERLATIDAPGSYDDTQDGPFTTAHNFDLRDGRLYSSWYSGGVKLHDVSDPTAPEELAWWRDPDEAVFWTAQRAANDVFVASSAEGGAGFDFGVPGRLYTFPDRAGEQPDPPSLTDPPEATDAANENEDDGGGTTPAGSRVGEPSDPSPGFGPLAALVALGIGAARLLGGERDRQRDNKKP